MDDPLDLKGENARLRERIIRRLRTVRPAIRDEVSKIAETLPFDADERAVNANLKRPKQTLIDSGEAMPDDFR
jgi:hypothetical protein